MYKKILVPLDGSIHSEVCLPLVRTFAENSQAEIILFRVAEYPYSLYSMCYEYPSSDPELTQSIENQKKAIYLEVKSYLERLASTLTIGRVKVTAEVSEGPVVEAILAAADGLHIDLIALTTCGQSKCTQCVMGATADRVLHEASVPVILIRPTPFSCIPSLSSSMKHLPLYI
jgi:nucleotide-binding universal stress UspA family protein